LTYKHFNSDCVTQWRLFFEEYSPNLGYIKGTKNVAADALSCLGILNSPKNKEHFTEALPSELYVFDDEDLPKMAFPLSYAFLGKAQSTEVAILKERAQTKSLYSIQPFTGVGKTKRTHLLQWQDYGPQDTTSKSHPIVPQLPWTSQYQSNQRNHWSTPLVAKSEKSKHKLSNSLLH
jgi:hypothetical protein